MGPKTVYGPLTNHMAKNIFRPTFLIDAKISKIWYIYIYILILIYLKWIFHTNWRTGPGKPPRQPQNYSSLLLKFISQPNLSAKTLEFWRMNNLYLRFLTDKKVLVNTILWFFGAMGTKISFLTTTKRLHIFLW